MENKHWPFLQVVLLIGAALLIGSEASVQSLAAVLIALGASVR